MRNALCRTLVILIAGLLHNPVAMAQFEEGKTTSLTVLPLLQGNALNSSPALTNTYVYQSNGATNRTLKNIIDFHINENATIYFASGFTAVANVTVVTKATVGSTPVSDTRDITINYDKTEGAKYTPRAYWVLPASEQVTLTVNRVTVTNATGWNPLTVLQVDNTVTEVRYYNLQNFVPSFNLPINNTDALNVSWYWPAGTNNNMSQLEWAWVETEMQDYYNDANGAFSADKLFNSNATRVDLDFGKDNFNIPLLYDGTGTLYYRLRPALRKNDGNVFTGSWSAVNSYAFGGHEPALNWQSSTSFAENGKSKTVIQYFDGSLRSRQVVTKDNVTGNTVVGETIYDLQGRPNVQILPTPTLDKTIQYFKDFNRFQNMALNDDPAKYFDLTPATGNVCAGSPMLDTTQGNGKYYSANNPWLATEANTKYIPDAYGYAYTETRFMDDASGRVRSQGGVGQTHQVGSGHETKYYYGKPNQAELDALFGTEVGDASHYSKNMVQDANGQLSVSYTDMHGRTIATALAGAAPASMNDISNNTADYPQPGAALTNQLLTPLTNIANGNTIENINTILVTMPNSPYHFTYKLDPGILSQFSCTNQQICFDCKYNLEIAIKSEDCGAAPPIVLKYDNLQIQPAGQACTTSMGFTGQSVINVKQIDTTISLPTTGSWVIRKTLTINDSLYQQRRDSALKVFLCKTEQNIYDSVYNVLYTTSGCGLPANNTSACDSCLSHLGTYDSYRINYLRSISANINSHVFDALIQQQYTADSLACAGACNTTLNPEFSTLKMMRSQMLADMIPFSGQYAIPVDSMNVSGTAGPDYNRLEARYNIFSTQYQTSIRTPFFHLPKNEAGLAGDYRNDAGGVDSTIEPNGDRHIILDTITSVPFKNLFAPTWANSLIYYHPEFSKLQFAEQNLASTYNWMDKVQAEDTYAGAASKGYLDPLNNSGTNAANADPFYQITANAAAKAVMNNRLTVSLDGTSPGAGLPSIWQVANSSVLCAGSGNSGIVLCSTYKTQLDPAITVDSLKDEVWSRVKTLYFTYRNEKVLDYIDANATNALNTADKNALIDNKKQLTFANQQNFIAQNGGNATVWDKLNTLPPDTTGMDIIFSNPVYNTDKCEAQRPFWKARLKQCEQLQILLKNELPNDTLRVNNIINKILDGLVSVCHNSLTAQQPNGASNTAPGYTGAPKSFEDVINKVFADSGIIAAPATNYFCNPYTIDYPKPYGLTTPLYANTTNTIDSCGCDRFKALKAEAGADSVSFTRMNSFLMTNYQDTISAVLWAGLQKCNSALRDTCTLKYDTATYTGTYLVKQSTKLVSGIISPVCPLPVITSFAVVPGQITVNYTSPVNYNACTLYINDANTNVLYSQELDCGATEVIVNEKGMDGIDPCTPYKAYIISTATTGTCSYAMSATYRYSGCIDGGCPDVPTIRSIGLVLPTPTNGTQNVSIRYTIAAGGANCMVKALQLNANGTYTTALTQPVACNSISTLLNLPACYKYRFVVQSDYTGTGRCGIEISDTSRLDSCWHTVCSKLFTPIILPSVVTIPSFLNCGYSKPCITCGKLDTLTTDFRNLYGGYCSGVPFTGSAITADQLKQNALWARYLNYKTGFSASWNDYALAYNNCHTGGSNSSTTALCRFTKPANDPGGIFVPDSLPCRAVQTQATYLAQTLYQQRKDALIANFDSLYHAKCLNAKYTEQFYVTYQPREYHYTLYYYDQAGNLVKTIPPAAVKPNFDPAYLISVANARLTGADVVTSNNEVLATQYRYNTLNQVIWQTTPDAGTLGTVKTSNFWYDRLGRLVVSQNPLQRQGVGAGPHKFYSYTKYDALGRITEVGQKMQVSNPMTQAISRDDAALAAWIADRFYTSFEGMYAPNNTPFKGTTQITRTVYDEPYQPLQTAAAGNGGFYQKNLRNRVSYTYVVDKAFYLNDANYVWNSATLYSYDIHGNVDTLLQDYGSSQTTNSANVMNSNNNRWKRMVYNYDLISGKVNSVAYQPGKADAFYHRYNYDAENRLTSAETSKDSVIWETDARYSYYRHGPLARTVLGQLSVQGLDYAYTLQGWLKGVNSTAVGDGSFDMGNDGATGSSNSLTARDAFGFSLNYFNGDYNPLGQSVTGFKQPFTTGTFNLTNTDNSVVAKPLYNGNIAAMVVALPKFNQVDANIRIANVYGYKYDQLNRINSMDMFVGVNNSNNVLSAAAKPDYKERITYDPNGNIKTYLRNGDATRLAMDNLTYTYKAYTNQLDNVNDAATDASDPDYPKYNDIKQKQPNGTPGQAAGNYKYDAIGNLTSDISEGITNIVWTVYGKIQSITKSNGTTINYTYDAAGNRISKAVTTGGVTKTTWYVRDASGNVMSVYSKDATINSGDLSQTEIHLYGSSRLGILNTATNVQNVLANTTGIYTFTRGNKFFELSNHLGNVLVTISDKKLQVADPNNPAQTLYYTADVVTASDYYPGGMLMPGRKYQQGTSTYRYSINGQEKESELNENITTAMYWEYDSRIVRRWNVDPVVKENQSPYLCFSGNPVWRVDPYGNTDSTISSPGGKNQSVYIGPQGSGAKNFKNFSGGSYKLEGSSGTTVQPEAGTVKSFELDGHTFNAYFSESTGAFRGYQTITQDGKLQSYDDFFKEWNEGTVSAGEVFHSMIGLFKLAQYWGSPIKNTDAYISMQIKDDQRIPIPENNLIESSKFTWTIAGIQGGYNTANGGGFYGQAGTFNNNYLDLGFYPAGNSTRITPFSGSLWSVGNTRGSGDFNIQGRTLITVAKLDGIDAQLDFNYTSKRFTGGFRFKGDVPIPFMGGNQKFETAAGARYEWGWPRAFQNWSHRFGF